MAMKYKTVGGQPTSGVGKDFASSLESLLTGGMGSGGAVSQYNNANPTASTGGVAGTLSDILSGGAGVIGGSMQKMISQQETNDVSALRSRFGAGGGAAFGTPAAYAESTYGSTVAPQLVNAIGGLQMNAIGQLLPQYENMYNRSTPQAESVGVQNPWTQGIGLAGTAAGAIFGGPAGAAIGGSIGGSIGGMFGGGAAGPVATAPDNPWINSMAGAPGAGASSIPSWSMPNFGSMASIP